ncbi:MAG: hypothetical protein KKF44_04400 [Nanoarchaeota archaeon]|nr:hypothetical protein [Nanoarchaeota archaeon]
MVLEFSKLEKPYYKLVSKCRFCRNPFTVDRKSKLFSAKIYCKSCYQKHFRSQSIREARVIPSLSGS